MIKYEIISDKIKIINFVKNNTKIIIKYFIGTERNIEEFKRKIELDLNNLFDSFDNCTNYEEKWIENIVTNINNYSVNIKDYFFYK